MTVVSSPSCPQGMIQMMRNWQIDDGVAECRRIVANVMITQKRKENTQGDYVCDTSVWAGGR